jgi:cell division transport system permease protein
MQSNLPFLIAHSFKGLYRNRLILLPAGVTLFLCSLLFMISLSLLQGVYHLDIDSEEVWKIRVFLDENIDSKTIKQIETNIDGSLGVQKLEFINSKKAKEIFVEKFGEEWFGPLESNPLPASWDVWPIPSYRNSYRLDQMSRQIQSVKGVTEVITSAPSLRLLESKKWQILMGATAVGILLLGTLWLILRNSVRLSLLSRKLLVENMKYLGASYKFILFPFVFEAMVLSVFSCVIAMAFWFPFYWGVRSLFPFFELSSAQIIQTQLPVLVLVSYMAISGTIRSVKLFLWTAEE